MLFSRGMANPSDCLSKVQGLFPVAPTPPCPEPLAMTVEADDIRKVLKKLHRGTSAGPSGLRTDHLLQVLDYAQTCLADEMVECIASFVQRAVSGQLPVCLGQWLTGGEVIPFNKKDGGSRPVVPGEVLRAVASRYISKMVSGAAREFLPI